MAEGGDAAQRVGVWVGVRVGRGGEEVEVEGAQQGRGGLAAGRGGAAIGDGGVRPFEGGGVVKGRHCNGCPGSRLCRGERERNT